MNPMTLRWCAFSLLPVEIVLALAWVYLDAVAYQPNLDAAAYFATVVTWKRVSVVRWLYTTWHMILASLLLLVVTVRLHGMPGSFSSGALGQAALFASTGCLLRAILLCPAPLPGRNAD